MEGWVFPFFSFVIFPRRPSPSTVVLFPPVFDTILLLVSASILQQLLLLPLRLHHSFLIHRYRSVLPSTHRNT
jgi:hypothetical protein